MKKINLYIFSIIQIEDKNFKYYLIKEFQNFLDFYNFFIVNKLINYHSIKKSES